MDVASASTPPMTGERISAHCAEVAGLHEHTTCAFLSHPHLCRRAYVYMRMSKSNVLQSMVMFALVHCRTKIPDCPGTVSSHTPVGTP